VLAQLGPYLIDEELAQGGMARVFRARLRGLGGFEKRLVIKQIRPELARDPRFVELFVREANTLVSLSHPHIVQVYELGAVEGTYYLSMEYVEGATVARMLEQGPLAPALVAHLGAQISEALEYAHSRFGILHRDITPRNIIVDQAGHARLVDFGIAGSADVAEELAFGSPGYMPPEQVARRTLSPQSDLFALGAVLYEALCARPAFTKEARTTLEPVAALPPGLDPAWNELLSALLAEDASERPRSAGEVARALRTLLARTNPHGALEEMQRRVREAARVDDGGSSAPSPEKTAGTARVERPREQSVEARAIATSPVLTEILRSSALAPIPKPPVTRATDPEGETRPIRAPTPASGAENAKAPSDGTDARLTQSMLRIWPLLSLLALLAALFGRSLLGSEPTSEAVSEPPVAPVDARDNAREPNEGKPRADSQISEPKGPELSAPEPSKHVVSATPATNASTTVEPSATPNTGQSSLSVNAKPWAEVKLDGRAVGVTPLRKLKLRPGIHVLSLHCPPLGRDATLKLDLKSAQNARVLVDLTEAPPRTALDGVSEAR
jgi:tRNA A-37 threonylcarbamoyl transferase component Bud32